MCGLDGIHWLPGETPPADLLALMTSRMSHRGPDAQGTFASQHYGLGHRRLKIIDLSDEANQPMFSEDGRLGLVFNGEIYNFLELRSALEALGRRFRTRSDSEVILEAFAEWGEDAFRKLNGIFAFALCDLRGPSPVFYLVRDRFGTKPLFYAQRAGRLAFASELKPLMEVSWIGREINREVLFDYLKFSHVPAPHSILKDVRQVRPGHWIRFENGSLRDGVYWDPMEMARTPAQEGRSEEDWIDEMDEVLSKVVKRQLISDVPVGCLLSGGIDSSLLAMAAARHTSALKTFTIGYRESEFDESPHAREVAAALGTDHHEIVAGPRDLLDLVGDLPRYCDQPLADPTLLPTLLLCRFTRKSVTVALSGDGGDELFFGYTFQKTLRRLAWLAARNGALRRLVCAAADQALSALPRCGGRRGHIARKALQILQFRGEAELFSYFIGTIGPMRLDRLSGLLADPVNGRKPPLQEMMADLEDLPWEKKIEQVFVRSFLTDTVLAKTDRASMAFGLEGRVPFLDDEMVRFSDRLPFDLKLRGPVKKYLPRRLLARRLPRISERPKQGFSIPLRGWLRGELRPLLSEYLDPPRLRREGYFNADRVATLTREHLADRANHSHLLWSILSFQMWKQWFGV